MVVYEDYLLERLLEELKRAQRSKDPAARRVHERACHYYGELLQSLRIIRDESPKLRL
jgi:hypothetical protein